ncbi:MAG: winged helix-turn-helix transcriptional regulator [Candidatus Bathyarchaeota archaeon]|nr:winged helix-turn-helix domain-containing protein [Candidatus Bathyarchaeum tardum]WGM89744.1 MAG: winged helix-turn-helix domain-containing protein [Candidatus Bathyarchaeum tardum]WNZ30160.1 MAG: winged helix-turn-helix transcriptional regulator [Candidatus Bathyarchaeota archaeon]
MTLKLQLVRDGKIVLEVPLSLMDWPKEQLETEFEAFEDDFERFSSMFDALSNQTRLRMMRRLVQDENITMNFAGFMKDLDLNPKTVWENSRKLSDGGFLTKTGRGTYSCSEFGQTTFLTLSLALRRLLESLNEENV